MSVHKELENFIQLQKLLSDASKTVMKAFANVWKENYGTEWVDSNTNYSDDLIQFKNIITTKANPSQKKLINIGNSNEWDITLFFLLFSTEPFSRSKYVPFIRKINYVRNRVN